MGKIADRHFEVDPWTVREAGFDPAYQQMAESIFSLGNGFLGVRGYFEEGYTGKGLQGSYVSGVYERRELPKSGYKGMIPHTEFMVNAVDWLYTRIRVNGVLLNLASCDVSGFERTLDLKTGVLTRAFTWRVDERTNVSMVFERFLSMERAEMGAQRIVFRALEGEAEVAVVAGLDFSRPHVSRGENLWTALEKKGGQHPSIAAETRTTKMALRAETAFSGMTYAGEAEAENEKIAVGRFIETLRTGESCALTRIARVTRPDEAEPSGEDLEKLDYDQLKAESAAWWALTWAASDIMIEGDDENQQGIRYCIFQLHQTLHSAGLSAIIGAKGLTGEAYNGNTFWDTEVFCLPFYLFNNPDAARSILNFRYETLPQARARARALDLDGAFYPVATISGTECCDLWQHASLQLQASTGVMVALSAYQRTTGDTDFLYAKGAEMLVEICRMLASRGGWNPRGEFGFYGVMGPDEFQMMVHHNAYTNFLAKKCFLYTLEVLEGMGKDAPDRRATLAEKTGLNEDEIAEWRRMADHMRLPYDPETLRFEQHDGFFGLPHIDIGAIPATDFPLYSHWSYERIYRNDMLKQPDVLMFMFLFGSEFSLKQLAANFDYYEPRCIHESSLSPSVHSILASRLGRSEQAYEMFRFAARLDLDNYNRNTDEGLHITSIAGSWMNIVYGFGGLKSDGGRLSLSPSIPSNWEAFSFNLQYRGCALSVKVTRRAVELAASGGDMALTVYGRPVTAGAEPLSILMP